MNSLVISIIILTITWVTIDFVSGFNGPYYSPPEPYYNEDPNYYGSGNIYNDSIYNDNTPFWSTVASTWCFNKSASHGKPCFKSLPQTAYEAYESGWDSIDDEDDCYNGGRYNGYRYIRTCNYKPDFTLVLLYDINGYIAGVQAQVRASEVAHCRTADCDQQFRYEFENVRYYTRNYYHGQLYYTLTVYFVEPEYVCRSGRDLPHYYSRGVGDRLYLQAGETPYTTLQISPYRREALKYEDWTCAKCFSSMGCHNFRSMESRDANNCKTFEPLGALYDNDGHMNGFVFMFPGNVTASPCHFINDHISNANVRFVMNGDNSPSCLGPFMDCCDFTLFHIFFDYHPERFICDTQIPCVDRCECDT